MMRCLSKAQKELYQQYSRLSEVAGQVTKLHAPNKPSSEIWELISKEGIWGLPIPKQYGGKELSWQDCVVAIDGFFSNYSDTKFLTLLMSQVSVLYLISRYGTEPIKKRYLPRLIQGEIASLVISRSIYKLAHDEFSFSSNTNNYLNLKNNKICIHAKKIKNDIVFFISEKLSAKISINKSFRLILDEEDMFISKEKRLAAICDLINFERICYGILSRHVYKKLRKSSIS